MFILIDKARININHIRYYTPFEAPGYDQPYRIKVNVDAYTNFVMTFDNERRRDEVLANMAYILNL